MIPTGSSLRNARVQTVQQPSPTYRLDFAAGWIVGRVDGLEAVRQAIYKILQTDRFRYPIYSFNYGNEFGALIGVSLPVAQSEVSRLIEEALTQDDRIRRIENLNVSVEGDRIDVAFTAVSTFGDVDIAQEVTPHV